MIALPELIKLVKNMQQRSDEKAKIVKVKKDIKKINEAFDSGDERALREVFNS